MTNVMNTIKGIFIKVFKIDEEIARLKNLNNGLLTEKTALQQSFSEQLLQKETEIVTLREQLQIPSPRQEYYDNKWKKSPIQYSAQFGLLRDVRTFIPDDSSILMRFVKSKSLDKGTDDEKALKILKFVKSWVSYTGDSSTHNSNEFWQHPEETIQTRKGDCEDGAMLIKSLCNLSGIPDYKVKVCAGWVKTSDGKGGHAYSIYLRDDDTWCILDWCYYYTSVSIDRRIEHKEDDRYNPIENSIWWTFNHKFGYAQTSTEIVGDEFKKDD